MFQTVKQFFKKYKHAVLLAYFAFYMPWFSFLNTFTPARENVTMMHCPLDDYIPFCEWFAIPYFIWFAYIAFGFAFLIFTSRREFVRMCIFLYTGMTICLIIYTIFPNGQNLRVDYTQLGRNNILISVISSLQSMDTPFNVFPSIHCLNSIGMHIAIAKSKNANKPMVICSFILAVLIILSTVFIKQHSIVDMFGAFVLAVPLYFLAYKPKYAKITEI